MREVNRRRVSEVIEHMERIEQLLASVHGYSDDMNMFDAARVSSIYTSTKQSRRNLCRIADIEFRKVGSNVD